MVYVIARPRRFRELVGVPINVRALWWTRADGSVVAFSQAVNKVGQIFDARAEPKTSGIAAAPSAMAAVANVTVARDANRYAINFLYNQ